MDTAAAIAIVRLTPGEAQPYRALMLEAYAREPDAFTSTPEERAALPMSWWEKRLRASLGGAALAAARADGTLRIVTLTVSEGNGTAQSLYERFGFRAFGTEPCAI